jgi:hypothetical protein
MNKQDKRRRNRARSCNVCDHPMAMDDRKLYLSGVAHRQCANTDDAHRTAEALNQSRVASEKVLEAVDRWKLRARAHGLGLWVP